MCYKCDIESDGTYLFNLLFRPNDRNYAFWHRQTQAFLWHRQTQAFLRRYEGFIVRQSHDRYKVDAVAASNLSKSYITGENVVFRWKVLCAQRNLNTDLTKKEN